MTRLTVAIASLALTGAAQAADVYTIDPNHTFANFEFVHLGFATFRAKFAETSGTVTLDMAKKQGHADITINPASVVTGVPKFDEHLKSADFFDVARYPTIRYVAHQFTFEGDKLTEVTGDLTMHGVTKPVTLKVTAFNCKPHPFSKRPACGADAETVIKRSEWGLGRNVPAVSDEVKIVIGIEAENKEAQPVS